MKNQLSKIVDGVTCPIAVLVRDGKMLDLAQKTIPLLRDVVVKQESRKNMIFH